MHTYIQRCRVAFTACQRVSWKIGQKAEPVARRHHCHIWYFFSLSLSCSLSHTDSIYSVPDASMLLDAHSYKCLPAMHILFYNLFPTLWHTLSLPLLFCPMRHSGTENKRKMSVSWRKDKKIHWNFEHVAYTGVSFLFMHAYSHEPQSQTCFPWHTLYKVPHITPTAHTRNIHHTNKESDTLHAFCVFGATFQY